MAYSSSTTLCVLQTARSTTPSPFWPDLFIFPWCGSDCISCLPENVRKEQDKTRHLDDFVPTSGPACNHFIQCIFCHSSSTWFWTLYVTFKRDCDKKKKSSDRTTQATDVHTSSGTEHWWQFFVLETLIKILPDNARNSPTKDTGHNPPYSVQGGPSAWFVTVCKRGVGLACILSTQVSMPSYPTA